MLRGEGVGMVGQPIIVADIAFSNAFCCPVQGTGCFFRSVLSTPRECVRRGWGVRVGQSDSVDMLEGHPSNPMAIETSWTCVQCVWGQRKTDREGKRKFKPPTFAKACRNALFNHSLALRISLRCFLDHIHAP